MTAMAQSARADEFQLAFSSIKSGSTSMTSGGSKQCKRASDVDRASIRSISRHGAIFFVFAVLQRDMLGTMQ
jgi:hypothetical protein